VAGPRQARGKRACVRRLLRGKQPDFAAALGLAVWDLPGRPGREPPGRAASAPDATATVDIDPQLPGIDRLLAADASARAARAGTHCTLPPGPQHRPGLAGHRDVLARHGLCGEGTGFLGFLLWHEAPASGSAAQASTSSPGGGGGYGY
jgi:hypothetical protein